MSRPCGAISLSPIPRPAVSATAPHPVLRRFRRDAASRAPPFPPRRRIAAIRRCIDYDAIPSYRIRVRQRATASALRAGALTARHRVSCVRRNDHIRAHLAEQKIVRQVILSSGTSTPKGAYANGM